MTALALPPSARADGRIATPAGILAYTTAGTGEPLLLVHGLGGTRRTWRHLIDSLATTHTVIAVDLPGHGQSDSPAGDYSLGAHASALRDLLAALGHSSATLVGHSLGGGVALQFAYQFPERTDRVVLISSGGLGAEVSPMLRVATLPGAATLVAGLGRLPVGLTRRILPLISVVPGVIAREDARSVAEDLRGMARAQQRRAFLRTARSVIDWRGQTVSASRQLGLLADLPVLVTWGGRDRTIPPHHHRTLVQQLPDAHSLEIANAGHYPHETAPAQILPAIHAFLRTTQPYRPALPVPRTSSG
ncbi:alpha/beta fold hydrolase [Cryptosporangium minutisporangium]|uniref:Alpha/beta fold hydrolase n=1 Tax=Cryptosporangium minutisporangium TaxID=113569 RepID=A0ABP6SYS4_9ACTN